MNQTTKRTMFLRTKWNGGNYIITEGAHGHAGRLYGIFSSDVDANHEQGDELACAIVGAEQLTPKQLACARANAAILDFDTTD